MLHLAAALLSFVANDSPTITAAQLDAAQAYADANGSRGFLVMQNGKILRETYFRGAGKSTLHGLASGSKSFTGPLALAAVNDGLLDLDRPLVDILPEWKGDANKEKITVRYLLTLTSGLAGGGIGGSSLRDPWIKAVEAPSRFAPGSRFFYGPYPFHAFGEALQRQLRTKGMTTEQYLHKRLLDPLGVRVVWSKCQDGNPALSGGGAMTLTDWAKYGEWIRNGGAGVLKPGQAESMRQGTRGNPAYGLSWWLRPDAEASMRLRGAEPIPVPDWLPKDFFMAAGAGKQRLYIVPSRNLVAVRVGPIRAGGAYKDVEFLRPLLTQP
jgi:CubicO group peptidase (beta-lactamase class C family)